MPITTTSRQFEEFIPQPTQIDRTFEQMSPAKDPQFAQILQEIMGSIPDIEEPPELKGIEEFVQKAITSPLLQMILQPALATLERGAKKGRGNVVDAFRAAGGGKGPSRSTAFGQAVGEFESDVVGERGNLISQITSQTLSPLLQSLLTEQGQEQSRFFRDQDAGFKPVEALMKILQLVRPDLVQTEQTQTGSEFLQTGATQAASGTSSGDAASKRTAIPSLFGPEGPRSKGIPSAGGGVSKGSISLGQPNTTTGDPLLDAILINFGEGGGGIQFDPGTGGFVSTSGSGTGARESVADFNASNPYGID